MSAYEETEDGLIRASLADRIGKLLEQYERLLPANGNESYDATLTLVLLQALLTICHELLEKPPVELKKVKSMLLTDVPSMQGLGLRMVSSFFPGETQPNFYNVVEHLRHAVSHPLFPSPESNIIKTGFMAVNGPEGKIAAYKFIHSPDVKRGRNQNVIPRDGSFENRSKARRSDMNRLPREVQGEIVEQQFEDRIEFHLGGKLLQRAFVIEIPIPNLKEFVGELSRLLSVPLENRSEIAKQALV